MKTTIDLDKFKDLIRENRIAGDITSLTPELASRLGSAFGTILGKDTMVVTARDYREDSRVIKRAVSAGFMSAGVNMIDLHACPLPVLLFALKRFSAKAGIMFHATHREPETINVRVFNEFGIEIDLLELLSSEGPVAIIEHQGPNDIGRYLETKDAPMIYASAVRSFYTTQTIKPGFKVVADMALSPQADIVANILAQLGIQVITLNSYKPTAIPDILPNPFSLHTVSRTVIATKADFGIAFDPSGGRVVFIDEMGQILSSDQIAALIALFKSTGRRNATIVLSDTIERMPFENKDFRVVRVSDIPGQIARTIRMERAIWGASDQGAFYFPSFIAEAEPILAVLTILTILSRNRDERVFLSELIENILPRKTIGLPIRVQNVETRTLLALLDKTFGDIGATKVVDTLIGLKVVFEDGWIHVRPGLHPNKVIFQANAKDDDKAEKLYEIVSNHIKHLMEFSEDLNMNEKTPNS